MSCNDHTADWSGSSSSGSTSSSLLERVQAGQPQAWERLVDLYGPLIYHWCRWGGLQQADAADVAQEVFQTVARKIREFHHDRAGDTFRGWLRAITRNKLREHFRYIQARPQAKGGTAAQQQLRDIPALSDSRLTSPGLSEEKLLSHRALILVRGEFEDRTWQAFWRAVVQSRAPADVAQELGMSTPAVYQAKSRVLARLRRELSDPPT